MTVADLRTFYADRSQELDEYFRLLDTVELAAQSGVPTIAGTKDHITVLQRKILFSSSYLQLYNLVEATVSRCIDELTDAVVGENKWKVGDLSENLRREWVRSVGRTHMQQEPDGRLKSFLAACDHIIGQLPVEKFLIEKGGGGNWDDESIYEICKRLGCNLKVTPATRSAVKKRMRNNLGAMQLVKNRRNELAHGVISFVECADGVDLSDLKRTADAVRRYLREVIDCFTSYIELLGYLHPNSKSAGVS